MKASTSCRTPKYVGDIEFSNNASGIGSEVQPSGLTRFEAKLLARHNLSLIWAVEASYVLGGAGGWECRAGAYANHRLDELIQQGFIDEELIDEVRAEWDWPTFDLEPEIDPEVWEMLVLDDPDQELDARVQSLKRQQAMNEAEAVVFPAAPDESHMVTLAYFKCICCGEVWESESADELDDCPSGCAHESAQGFGPKLHFIERSTREEYKQATATKDGE